MSQLGGQDLSGIGFGLGLDRTYLACQAEEIELGPESAVDVYVVPLGAARRRAALLATDLRRADVRTDLAYGERASKSAMKSADRSGAPWVVVLGERDLGAGGRAGQEHGHRRPDRRPARRDRPPPRGEAHVIRTHDAGALRAEPTPARPSPSPGGWPGAATTAAWPSWTCARPAGSCRWSSATRRSRTSLRNEYCLKVTGDGRAAARGQRQPQPALGRDRGHRGRRRGAERRGTAALPPSTTTWTSGRRPGSEHRYLDLRRTGPNAALRLRSKVNTAARDVLDRHDFVEIETPTLTRSTPEGAPDFLVPGAAAARAAGTPCRRARSCSSSC